MNMRRLALGAVVGFMLASVSVGCTVTPPAQTVEAAAGSVHVCAGCQLPATDDPEVARHYATAAIVAAWAAGREGVSSSNVGAATGQVYRSLR